MIPNEKDDDNKPEGGYGWETSPSDFIRLTGMTEGGISHIFRCAFRELLRHPFFSEIESMMSRDAYPTDYSLEMIKILDQKQELIQELSDREKPKERPLGINPDSIRVDKSGVRDRALSLAVIVHRSMASEEGRVIKAAKEFEKYLLGDSSE